MDQEEELYIPDDALTEIAEIAPSLSEQERQYVYWRSIAYPPAKAFALANYKGSAWRTVETRPKIRTALADLNERLEPEYRVTRQTVVGILMEAVEIARRKDQPKILVEAAKELAEVTGVKAAAKLQIDQRLLTGQIVQEETKALRHLPIKTLEEFVGIERILPTTEIVEGEFEEVSK